MKSPVIVVGGTSQRKKYSPAAGTSKAVAPAHLAVRLHRDLLDVEGDAQRHNLYRLAGERLDEARRAGGRGRPRRLAAGALEDGRRPRPGETGEHPRAPRL